MGSLPHTSVVGPGTPSLHFIQLCRTFAHFPGSVAQRPARCQAARLGAPLGCLLRRSKGGRRKSQRTCHRPQPGGCTPFPPRPVPGPASPGLHRRGRGSRAGPRCVHSAPAGHPPPPGTRGTPAATRAAAAGRSTTAAPRGSRAPGGCRRAGVPCPGHPRDFARLVPRPRVPLRPRARLRLLRPPCQVRRGYCISLSRARLTWCCLPSNHRDCSLGRIPEGHSQEEAWRRTHKQAAMRLAPLLGRWFSAAPAPLDSCPP